MKNQYFGDFSDYQKFSLLKILRDVGCFKITVHWMKTLDDGSTDGKHVGYLNEEQCWNSFDKSIFDFIKGNINSKKRNLALYEKSTHAIGIKFVNDHIEDLSKRIESLNKIRDSKESDLIFFDPDNGIEVKSTSPKNIHKYVLWNDMKAAFSSGKSVLVYQSFSRQNREIFIQQKTKELKKHFSAGVFVVKVKYCVYFLIIQKHHKTRAHKSLSSYSKVWKSLVSSRNLHAVY